MITIEEYRKGSETAKKMTDEECQKIIELQDKFADGCFDIWIRKLRKERFELNKINIE